MRLKLTLEEFLGVFPEMKLKDFLTEMQTWEREHPNDFKFNIEEVKD